LKNGVVKTVIGGLFFPQGSVRRIRFGPLRNMIFRVGPITGLSPWYSGNERDQQRFFASAVRLGSIAIDVGANWGLHSLYLSRLVGSGGRILAVEPFPPAFRELEWHIKKNACANISAQQLALADIPGQGVFLPGNSPTTGSLVFDLGESVPQNSIPVTVRTLDDLVKESVLPRVDFIKVDAEGAEIRVLNGGNDTVAQFRPTMLIELHTPEQDVLVANWLCQRGYHLKRLYGPPIINLKNGWPDLDGVWGTIIASPVSA
jgi:FkbM family methyltransferase